MTRKILQVLALSTLVFAGSAQAVPIQFSIDGVVTFADAGNGFGLDVGDTVTATAIFDDSPLTGVGDERIEFGSGTGNTMSHSIGAFTFIESMDVDFADGDFPLLLFEDGIFAGWDFLVDVGVNDAPASYSVEEFEFAAGFTALDDLIAEVEGIWNLDTARFTAVAVPAPTTLVLLALGLLAIGLRQRA